IVKNLNFSNARMSVTRTGRYSAIVAARAVNGALIENCTVANSSVLSDSTAVGILAGEFSESVIRNCTVTAATVEGSGGTNNTAQWGTGGLVGIIDGAGMSAISGCSFNGSVTVLPAYNDIAHRGGGLVGVCVNSRGTEIENCSFSGTLSSEGGAVGGIAGQINGNTCIRHCTVAAGSTITGGEASGSNNVGGIVGYVSAKVAGYSQGEIASCRFEGSVTGFGQQTAGIAGRDENIPIHDCLVENATITGCNNTGGVAGILKDNESRNNRVISCVVQSSASTVGGIVASLQGSAYVMDCYIEGTDITSTYNTGATDTAANAGGIAGWVGGGTTSKPTRIVRCYSTDGAITAPGRRVGGIASVLAGPSLVDECWSDMNIDSGKGHAGGIVGSFDPGKDDMLVINCSYFGGFVRETSSSNGAVAGIVGSVAYTYAKGDIQNGYVVNCYANPASVSTAQYAAGGIGGYLCRHNVDNCFSPVPSSSLTSSSGSKYRGGAVGIMRRGGRTLNCYAVYQSDDSNDGYDSPEAANVVWKVTKLSDADAKASSASVVVPSTGATAASLIDALNQGADLYNNGGNATDLASAPYHGTPKYDILAKPWAQGSEGYPVPVCSPLFNGSTEDYAYTVTVDNPNLTIYMPARSSFTGKCVVVMPGGGYQNLPWAASGEGDGWASYYNNLGFACAVLRYTLPSGNPARPITDAENAIKYLRDHASSLHINSVGVHGFSAGGHLASTTATHYTAATRPDFQILFYPVITMGTGTHTNSKNNFLGTSPSDAMVNLYSNELQVTADTPKTFLMYYDNDGTVTPSANGAAYYTALNTAGVSVTRKIFTGTTHGWNNTDKVDSKTVRQHLTQWLNNL
ncbi:MAG: alpha/beta hydrolase, partial [Bacteroidales bacterium]|nr:alpha/beta hydrolase [Bacteroidales bacterium]